MSSDSIEDFKAAFVCITNSPDGYFKSAEELTRALQGCGKNPSAKKIDSIWRSNQRIDIDKFCEIASDENSITEVELLEAFRFIDINKNGYISTKDFITLFTTNGDSITHNDAKRLVEEADLNQDGKINYREFSKFIIDTIHKAKHVARKKMKKVIAQREFEHDHFYSDDHRSPSLRSHHEHNEYDSKSRRYSNQDDYSNRGDLMKRPNSGLRGGLTRENSNDSFRSTSKLRSNRNQESENERERERDHHHHRHREEDENDNHHHRHHNKNREEDEDHHNHHHHRNNDFDRIKKRDYHDYDDNFDRSSLKNHRNHENNYEDRNSRDRFLDEDFHRNRNKFDEDIKEERPRSRSRDKYREIERDREFEYENKKENFNERDSFRKEKLSKQNLFETKHKRLDKVVETLQEPKHLRKWTTKEMRGAFYFNETINSIISNSFALDLHVDSSVFVTIETFQTNLHTNQELIDMDVSILIVKDSKKLSLKGFTENKINNKWCTRVDLSAGRYFLFPFTSGCHLKKREFDFSSNKPAKYFERDINNKMTLTRKFKDALSVIFDICDLDSNGRLSQEELNLYTFLTANESLSEEEWHFVGETVGFERNELTKEGFIKLSKIEAKRDDTDLEDIAARLANLGFNKSLTIDQSCPYSINISCEVDQFDLLIGEIYRLKAADQFLSQIIEAKGVPKKVKGYDGLTAFEYHNNYLAFIEFENKTENEIKLDVDCSENENCLSNSKDFISSIKIKPMKNKIGMCLTAKNPTKEWYIKSSLTIISNNNDEQQESSPRRKFY